MIASRLASWLTVAALLALAAACAEITYRLTGVDPGQTVIAAAYRVVGWVAWESARLCPR